jgi:hypothetical protein
MPCGLTKVEAIVENVLAPISVQDFIDALKDPEKSSNLFCNWTDASSYKNRCPTGCEVLRPFLVVLKIGSCT